MNAYVIAKYIRLSVDDAQSESMSIPNQRIFLDKAIERLNEPGATVLEFVDNGYSGTNFERPAVQELLELVRAGGVNCIMVKDFSRFGRNAIETGYFLERIFPLYGVRFISPCDNYDSEEHTGDTGGLQVALKFLVHEQYSRDLSRKIKSAKLEKARCGEAISKNCTFGYRKNAEGVLEIDEEAAETVRLIFRLVSENKSLTEIAETLYLQKRPTPSEHKGHKQRPEGGTDFDCIWKSSAIRAILRNEQLTGTYVAGKTTNIEVGGNKVRLNDRNDWIRIPHHHPAIIEQELFDTVQKMRSEKKTSQQKPNAGNHEKKQSVRQSPLYRKVICGCCGHKMTLSATKNAVFNCFHTYSAPGVPCYRSKIRESILIGVVLDRLPAILKKSIDMGIPDQQSIPPNCHETSTDSLAARKRQLYEQLIRGEIDADQYKTAKTGLDAEYERMNRASTAPSETPIMTGTQRKQLNAFISEAMESGALSVGLVDRLLDKIIVFPDGQVEIIWKSTDYSDESEN